MYQLTATIRDTSEYDGTVDEQFVTITGTLGETEERKCSADFDVIGQDVICSFESDVKIGDYECVSWRSAGYDGWSLMKVCGDIFIFFLLLYWIWVEYKSKL